MAQTIEKKDGNDLLSAAASALLRALAADVKIYAGYDEDQRKALYKKLHAGKKSQDLARAQKTTQEVKEYLELLLKFINAEFDTLRIDMLPAQMEEEGLEGFKLEGVGRISLTGDLFVKVPNGVMPELIKWFKKNKLGDIATETVNSSTLKSFVKSRIETGKKYPDDLLKVTPYTRASITKG